MSLSPIHALLNSIDTPHAYMYAHNGKGFDTFMILNELKSNKAFASEYTPHNIVRTGAGILSL